ncbi:MAG: hypothetical protein U1E73_04275 [Planctomycetota bacterium]
MTAEPAARTAPRRGVDVLVFALFLLLPAVLLGDSLFGGNRFLPYDPAEFPPAAMQLSPPELAAVRATANYDATEAPIWFQVELQLAREAVAERLLPHWNPYVRTGAPMLAHGHLGLMNPLVWPALLFADPADGLLYLTYAMFALAGALMFGCLRALGLRTAGAAFGALAFAWSGTLCANGHWYMRMEPLVMLPGMLWAIVRIADGKGPRRWFAVAGLALAMMCTWMSGFPQYGIPVTLLAAVFGLCFVLRELRRGPGAVWAVAWRIGAGALLGVLLAMPQLLQMLEFYPLSNRPIDEAFDRAARHAFAPFGFLGYLLPDAFSHPGDRTLPTEVSPLPYLWSDLRHWTTGAQLLPNYNFTEYAVFPGTLPLLFAVLALLGRGPRWRWFALVAFAGVFVLATGAFGARAAYLLPGLKTVPPYRFVGPASALLAMLAAIGFDRLHAETRPWLLRVSAVVLAAVGGYAVATSTHPVAKTTADDPWLVAIVERYRGVYAEEFHVAPAQITPAAAFEKKFSPNGRDAIRDARLRWENNLLRGGVFVLIGAGFLFATSLRRRELGLRGWPAIFAFGATAVQLGLFGFALDRGQACAHPATDDPVHAFLRAQRDAAQEHRDGGFLVARGLGVGGSPDVWNLAPGTLAMEHIRDLNFYTFVDKWSDKPIRRLYGDGFILRGFVCDAFPDDATLELPWWDLMGLRYVLALHPMQHAGARVGPETVGGQDYFVYERPHALPRGFVVPALRVIDGEDAQIDALVQKDLEPRASVIVSGDGAAALGKLESRFEDAGKREVRFVHEDQKRLTVEVGPGDTGYLVLADTFFPGWQATLNGEPVPIVRGNLYQRVVRVPPMRCLVEFRFRADGFVPGLAIGGAAVLGLCLLLVLGLRRGVARTDADAG